MNENLLIFFENEVDLYNYLKDKINFIDVYVTIDNWNNKIYSRKAKVFFTHNNYRMMATCDFVSNPDEILKTYLTTKQSNNFYNVIQQIVIENIQSDEYKIGL